jgi:predicted SprT family Zn-dependent metalloprotease
MIVNDNKRQVEEEFSKLCKEWDIDEIPLTWSTRMTRTYGMFRWQWKREFEAKINFNYHIVLAERLTRHSLQAGMDVMKHELAHYIDMLMNGDTPPHGRTFLEINKLIGGSYKGIAADGTRLHVKTETPRQAYKYTCEHGNTTFKARQVKNPGNRYLKACGCYLSDCNLVRL